ncbi:MAG TPA: hypothetical protein VF035_00105 [Longimicrobiales bacterium]
MKSITRSTGWIAAILISGACASTSPGPAGGPETARRLVPDQPVRDGAGLKAVCARTPAADRMACYDANLLAVLKKDGVSSAMRVLDQLSALDVDAQREGHMLAHSIGLAAYDGPSKMSSRFRECSPILQSGCYHGVIQAYFVDIADDGGIDAVSEKQINDLCGDYRASKDGDWLLFQCVHGMGHGLAQLTGHDLRRTLSGCDKLASPWERDGCFGGAFMENIQEAVAPHHSVGRPDAAGSAEMDHGGMDHAAMGHGTATAAKLIDPKDPLYPCSDLPDRYLDSCYMMQTSVILHLNGGNFKDAAATCDKVEDTYRETCYQSLGRDVSAYTLGDFRRAVTLCANGDPAYQPWCHTGFVKNVIDVSADYRSGLGYCRVVTRPADRTACYRALGEEIAVLNPDPAARAAACTDVEPAFRSTCLSAAGVREGTRPQ